MSAENSLLHSLTRSKLYSSVNSKDQCSLHRWVLLKNSIVSSFSSSSYLQDPAVSEYPDTIPAYNNNNEEVDEEEDVEEELGSLVGTFMFPDAGHFVTPQSADTHGSEAEWLDSLLETLAEDEDDDYPSDSEIHTSVLPVDEDDDQLLSPTLSPLSSSDDLHQSRYYSPSVPYSDRFSSFDSPLTCDYAIIPSFHSSISPYEHPLPYHDLDDIEDSTVPDSIEDVSDDESDAPSTPSFGRSSTSLTLESSTSASSPTERSRLRPSLPHVYIDKGTSYLCPFELDPLPFPEETSHHTPFSAY